MLTIPAVFALCALSEEIIRVIYEHGAFTKDNTSIVASILFVYSIGLPGFVLIKALQPNFYAREDTRTPMIFTLISVFINSALVISLFPFIGGRGVAFAEVTAGWINTAFLLVTLLKRQQLRFEWEMARRILGIFVAASVMLLVIIILKDRLSNFLISKENLIDQARSLGIIISVSMLVYFPLAFLLSGIEFFSLFKVQRKGSHPSQ